MALNNREMSHCLVKVLIVGHDAMVVVCPRLCAHVRSRKHDCKMVCPLPVVCAPSCAGQDWVSGQDSLAVANAMLKNANVHDYA